jgi:hypothetical protein
MSALRARDIGANPPELSEDELWSWYDGFVADALHSTPVHDDGAAHEAPAVRPDVALVRRVYVEYFREEWLEHDPGHTANQSLKHRLLHKLGHQHSAAATM